MWAAKINIISTVKFSVASFGTSLLFEKIYISSLYTQAFNQRDFYSISHPLPNSLTHSLSHSLKNVTLRMSRHSDHITLKKSLRFPHPLIHPFKPLSFFSPHLLLLVDLPFLLFPLIY